MQFIKILSVASVFLAALWLIAPSGKSAQLFRYAVGIFTLAVIISTVGQNYLNLPKWDEAAFSDTATVNAAAISNDLTAYTVEILLQKCDINFKKVQIITDNTENESIDIIKAYVELTNPEDFNRASEIIKNQTGIILVDGV